jgi:3-oxoacyl-[acyl-carrier-protein] synthase-3
MIHFKNVFISKLSHYLPPQKISNQHLIDLNQLKMKASWIETRLGITERRWALPEQAASDLAAAAILQLGESEAPMYVSTISPDYLTPSTASEIKRKLNWTGSEPAVDVSAACAGFIFALEQAALRIQSGATANCFACATEVRSRFLNLSDRRTVFLFADAASAAHLTNDASKAQGELLWTATYTQSRGPAEIMIPAGGSKTPVGTRELENQDHKIRMIDGVSIEETIYSELIDRISGNLRLRNETFSDYDFIVFHQGNSTMLKKICARIGFAEEQTHINFNIYGNSSSASPGVALSEAIQLGKIKAHNRVLVVAMGAGYHLGIAALKWNV